MKRQRASRHTASDGDRSFPHALTARRPSRLASRHTKAAACAECAPDPWSNVATMAIRLRATRAAVSSSTIESSPPETASTSGPDAPAAAAATWRSTSRIGFDVSAGEGTVKYTYSRHLGVAFRLPPTVNLSPLY